MAGRFNSGRGRNRARRALRERRTRQAMGDAAYGSMVAEQDSRGFAWFGVGYVALLAIVFFTMSWLGL